MKKPAWLTTTTSHCCNCQWSYCWVKGQREKLMGKWKLTHKGYWDVSCTGCKKHWKIEGE